MIELPRRQAWSLGLALVLGWILGAVGATCEIYRRARSASTDLHGLTMTACGADSTSVDCLISRLPFATAQVQAPDTMRVGQSYVVTVALTPMGSRAQPRPDSSVWAELWWPTFRQMPPLTDAELVRHSPRMRATIDADGFEVTPLGDMETAVAINTRSRSEWRWRVTPRRGGRREIGATVSALLLVDGTEARRSYPVLPAKVFVRQTVSSVGARGLTVAKDVTSLAGVYFILRWLYRQLRRHWKRRPDIPPPPSPVSEGLPPPSTPSS